MAASTRGGESGRSVKRHAGRGVNRVGDRGERRHDRRLADAAHAVGMRGVRHLDDHRVDHRQIRGDRHPVVEEARVLHRAVGVAQVLLVERPADPLRRRRPASGPRRSSGGWRGRRPGRRCSASTLDRPVSRIDLDVTDVRRRSPARAARGERRLADDRPAGPRGAAAPARRCSSGSGSPAAPSGGRARPSSPTHLLAASTSQIVAARSAELPHHIARPPRPPPCRSRR